jgi:hypothetical protein
VEGSCEHGNEPSGSIKCWKFLSSCTTGDFLRRASLREVSYVYYTPICIEYIDFSYSMYNFMEQSHF